jgi:hypothetical protein
MSGGAGSTSPVVRPDAAPVPSIQPPTAGPLLRWSVSIILAVIFGALIFEAFDVSVFKRIGMAHEYCYLREPKLIWLHVISDLLIGVAYVSISATLGYLVFKASRDIPFHWVFLAFGLFIVSCGMTHFMEVWVIWEPVYWMSGYVKLVTAAASVATALVLFPLVPKVFRLIDSARAGERQRQEIQHLNEELEHFNYTVAHDLRAPLRGITGFGQALREDFASTLPPQAVDYIDKMQRSAAQMDTLICDLLKYTTVGRQTIQLRPMPLDATVRASLALLESELRPRDAAVRVIEPLPTVLADSTLLQLVFLNLRQVCAARNPPRGAGHCRARRNPRDHLHHRQRTRAAAGLAREALQDVRALPPRLYRHRHRPGHRAPRRAAPQRPGRGRARAERERDAILDPAAAGVSGASDGRMVGETDLQKWDLRPSII